MNKKIKHMISAGILLLGISLVAGVSVMAGQSDASRMHAWGSLQKDFLLREKEAESGEIYARGKNTVIYTAEIDQAADFYLLSGMAEQQAYTEAVDYVEKREALYQAAIKNGYTVTDQEVWDYVNSLKEFAETADNKADVMAVISQFDSEEEYWKYEFEIYQKDLPIQKYVKDLESAYKQKAVFSNANSSAEGSWLTYFEDLKSSLAQAEAYQVINK